MPLRHYRSVKLFENTLANEPYAINVIFKHRASKNMSSLVIADGLDGI